MLKADYPNLNDEQLPASVSVLEMDMQTFQKICPSTKQDFKKVTLYNKKKTLN
jgi:hypothetical protein